MLERKQWVAVWADEPAVEIIETASVGIGVRLHNFDDGAWRTLFMSGQGADEFKVRMTSEGVWLATQVGSVDAALVWLYSAVGVTNHLRAQLEAEADLVEQEVLAWEERQRRAESEKASGGGD